MRAGQALEDEPDRRLEDQLSSLSVSGIVFFREPPLSLKAWSCTLHWRGNSVPLHALPNVSLQDLGIALPAIKTLIR